MNVSELFDRVGQYLLEGFARIFSPTDDAYPVIGFQPYSGNITAKNDKDW